MREVREARGLSQVALAAAAGLSRQSVSAIEAGRATPAVDVALRLASSLDTPVEALFGAAPAEPEVDAALASASHGPRVSLARIGGRWVARALEGEAVCRSADGLGSAPRRGTARVRLLRSEAEVRENVALVGCAPGVGALADRLNARAGPGRFVWFPTSNQAALEALGARTAHLAAVHVGEGHGAESVLAQAREALGGRLTQVTLARWEVGLVTRRDDAKRIREVADLGRKGVRLVRREVGSGVHRLLEVRARQAGLPLDVVRGAPLQAQGHLEVARQVKVGAADVGVAAQDAALAWGLRFVPLAEERVELVLPAGEARDPRLARLLDVVASAAFRQELSALGYDTRCAGERVEVPCAPG